MKKKLSILVVAMAALVLAFALAGCDKEPSVKIALGGNLGNYEDSGVCYGSKYKKIDTPAGHDYEDSDIQFYYCADCDTPYIAVYRWDATGMTLEESLKASAAEDNVFHYELTTSSKSEEMGIYYCGSKIDGDYYYATTLHLRDGNDAVEISFFAKTKEVAIGSKGLYAYIPTGYKDKTSEVGSGYSLYATYEDCYYNPDISIEYYNTPETYEHLVANWSYWYKDKTFPVTAEDWSKYQGDVDGISWTYEDEVEFYGKLGYKLIADGDWQDVCGAKVCFDLLNEADVENGAIVDVIYINMDGEIVEVWLEDDTEHFSRYADTFINSIHTK